jgi:hypothetical protein
MKFTEFKTFKLLSAPAEGDNPPAGSIFVWESLDESDVLVINYRLSDGTDKTFSGGAAVFTDLTDVPAAYTDKGGYKVKVKSDESGLEFVEDTGGGELPVTALGTSGTQTINRAASDKWTLTPASAVTLTTSNFTDMQTAELLIINGGTNVSYPATWIWKSAIPTLYKSGFNRLKLSYNVIGAIAKYIVEQTEYYLAATLLLKFNNNSNDSSRYNHATTSTDMTYTNTSGKFGYAGVFNGTSSKVTVADSTQFDIGLNNEPFTISFWAKTSQAALTCLFAKHNSAETTMQYMFQIQTAGEIYWYWNEEGKNLFGGSFPKNGAWHYVVIVYNGTTTKIAVDGVWQGSSDNSVYTKSVSSSIFDIGRGHDNTYFQGEIDEFCIDKGSALYTIGTNFTPPTTERL